MVDSAKPSFKQRIEPGAKYHEKALVKGAKSHGTVSVFDPLIDSIFAAH